MKECRNCHSYLPQESFERATTCKSGFRSTCRKCRQKLENNHKTTCKQCGGEFMSSSWRKRIYCSQQCHGVSQRIHRGNTKHQRRRQSYLKWYRSQHPALHAQIARRKNAKANFGMSEETFISEHASRNGCCDICGLQCTRGPSHGFEVSCDLRKDHCHTSGEFRGLLCHRCNIGLGHFRDDQNLLDSALVYIKRRGIRLVKS